MCNNNIAVRAMLLREMISNIKGEAQAKVIWKQDSEANVSAQREWEWGVKKASQWATS